MCEIWTNISQLEVVWCLSTEPEGVKRIVLWRSALKEETQATEVTRGKCQLRTGLLWESFELRYVTVEVEKEIQARGKDEWAGRGRQETEEKGSSLSGWFELAFLLWQLPRRISCLLLCNKLQTWQVKMMDIFISQFLWVSTA